MNSNAVRLLVYLVGLGSVGYFTWFISHDMIITGCITLIAHWLKPFKP